MFLFPFSGLIRQARRRAGLEPDLIPKGMDYDGICHAYAMLIGQAEFEGNNMTEVKERIGRLYSLCVAAKRECVEISLDDAFAVARFLEFLPLYMRNEPTRILPMPKYERH